MRRTALAGVLATTLSVSLGCSSSSSGSDDDVSQGGSAGTGAVDPGTDGVLDGIAKPAPEAAWTLLLYGHGDHNLSNSLLLDLKEMAAANLSADVNVLALTDWDASQAIADTDPPTAFPSGVQLFRIPGNSAELELLAEGEEQNLDDPSVLAEVVAQVFHGFPARRRAVVLWDHGGAWKAGFGSDTQDGTVARPQPMEVEVIPEALRVGLEQAGVTANPPLDLLAFDTCLMAGAEVAYPFRDLAQVYIANAEIDYGAGWDYTASLSFLAARPEQDARAFAREEVAHWDAHHRTATANDALLRSHVALDLSALQSFADATSELTEALAGSSSFNPIELGQSSAVALPAYSSQFENGTPEPELRDFGQLLEALSYSASDSAVASAAAEARTRLQNIVLASSQGTIRTDSQQIGVHVELNLAAQLTPAVRQAYASRASQWVTASGWNKVLDGLVAAADATPPVITHSVLDGVQPTLQFWSDDADVSQASVYLAHSADERTLTFLGLIGAGMVEPGETYEFPWDGSSVAFADGQPAMLDTWLDVGASGAEPVLMIPGLLSGAADEPLLTSLVFGATESSASVAVVSMGEVASTLTVEEIATAAPGSTFTPVYIQLDAVTGESALVTGDPMPMPSSGAFELVPYYAPPGTYQLLTSMTDVWGNQAAELDPVTVSEGE